ncbi:MAG: hypothetical protein RXP97_01825 [Nitrososphaeria archaeon]
MKILMNLKAIENGLAGRALVYPGRIEGEVMVQVPGEWPVLNYYLEGSALGDDVELRAAYREDVYGTYSVSMHAVVGWLRQLGLEVRVV